MCRVLDPIGLPASFWTRADVFAALSSRDIGALFTLVRGYTGASQTRIGLAVVPLKATGRLFSRWDFETCIWIGSW